MKPKNEPVIASAVSIEEIKDDAIVEDDSAHDYNKVIVPNTMNTADTQRGRYHDNILDIFLADANNFAIYAYKIL